MLIARLDQCLGCKKKSWAKRQSPHFTKSVYVRTQFHIFQQVQEEVTEISFLSTEGLCSSYLISWIINHASGSCWIVWEEHAMPCVEKMVQHTNIKILSQLWSMVEGLSIMGVIYYLRAWIACYYQWKNDFKSFSQHFAQRTWGLTVEIQKRIFVGTGQ